MSAYFISEYLRMKTSSFKIEESFFSKGKKEDNFSAEHLSYIGIKKGIFIASKEKNIEIEKKEDKNEEVLEFLTLKGVIYGFPLRIRRALIQKEGENSAKLYKLNDKIYGYVLCNIGLNYIELLDNYGEKHRLNLFEKIGISGRNMGKKKSSNYKKLSINRAELQRLIAGNMENVLTSMNASLYRDRESGEVIGFRVNSVRRHSIAERIGFRKRDIIKAVNGYRLDSVEKAMKLWEILKNENRVKIELERDKKTYIWDIEIGG